jgi:hypothetical protein
VKKRVIEFALPKKKLGCGNFREGFKVSLKGNEN